MPAETPLNRAKSSRNAGRNHLGTPSDIKSEWWATSSRIRGRLHLESAACAASPLAAADGLAQNLPIAKNDNRLVGFTREVLTMITRRALIVNLPTVALAGTILSRMTFAADK